MADLNRFAEQATRTAYGTPYEEQLTQLGEQIRTELPEPTFEEEE